MLLELFSVEFSTVKFLLLKVCFLEDYRSIYFYVKKEKVFVFKLP